MRIPAILTAGDSAAWVDYAFGDPLNGGSIDASSYTLSYSIRGPIAAAQLDLPGTASGTSWAFALTSAQSAAFNDSASPLKWFWQAYATKSGARVTAGQGVLLVRPNLAGFSNAKFDGRSQAEQNLAAIEAEISARITGGATIEYTIGTRSLKKEPMAALMQLRSQYRLTVSRERRAQAIANGLGNPQKLGIRFQ
jgi:hypothetical protein